MEKKDGFRVEIRSGYELFWRYNLAVTCGCFDADDNRTDFFGAEDVAAPVGSNLTAPPDDLRERRGIDFTTSPCDHLLMYVYVIPNTLPEQTDIAECKPFDMTIRVTRGGQTLFDSVVPVNCWSGCSMELRIPKEKH